MPRPRRYPKAASALRRLVDTLGQAPLRAWLFHFFEQPGWLLARTGAPRWSGFVMQPALVLGASETAAACAAALVEVAVAGIDIADDLIDGDWVGEVEDQHRAMNAAVGLGLLTQAALVQLAAEIGAERAIRVAERAARWSLGSVDGQDRDVLMERRLDVPEDEALEVTRRKSGSLARMAFEVGAAVATDDEAVIEAIGELGESVGLIAQLLNDLGGLDPTGLNKTDFRARTKTAPAAFLLRAAREDGLQSVLDWYADPALADPAHEQELARLAREVGALDFAWVLADTCRREARAALEAAAARLREPRLLRLLPLLPSVRARATRVA